MRPRAGGRAAVLLSASRPRFWAGEGRGGLGLSAPGRLAARARPPGRAQAAEAPASPLHCARPDGGAHGLQNRRQGGREPQLPGGHSARREMGPARRLPGAGAGLRAPAGLHTPAQAPPWPAACVWGRHPEADLPLLSLAPCTPPACASAGPTPRPCGPTETKALPTARALRSPAPRPGSEPAARSQTEGQGSQVAWPGTLTSRTLCPRSLKESEFVRQVPFCCPRALGDSVKHSTRLPAAEQSGGRVRHSRLPRTPAS